MVIRPTADYWIKTLQLHTHIEGGAFREIYRSALTVSASALPPNFTGDRNFCTSIYFLLQEGQFSAFHRIKSDEIWHFYFGDALMIYEIEEEGNLVINHLGNDPQMGKAFQCVVKAGNWFAAVLAPGGEYALTGCTVSPGFDFNDFELAEQSALIEKFPQHTELIISLSLPS